MLPKMPPISSINSGSNAALRKNGITGIRASHSATGVTAVGRSRRKYDGMLA
jgi:hypothetical protein